MPSTQDRLTKLANEQSEFGHYPEFQMPLRDNDVSAKDAVAVIRHVCKQLGLEIPAVNLARFGTMGDLASHPDMRRRQAETTATYDSPYNASLSDRCCIVAGCLTLRGHNPNPPHPAWSSGSNPVPRATSAGTRSVSVDAVPVRRAAHSTFD